MEVDAEMSDALDEYVAALDQLDPSIDAEDNLKRPVHSYIDRLRQGLHIRYEQATTEQAAITRRPDMTVSDPNGVRIIGYVELKRMFKSSDPRKLSDKHDKQQWQDYMSLPNLIYCNGRKATLWRDGAQVGTEVAVDDVESWTRLWDEFLDYTPTIDSEPKPMAKTMGRRARLLRVAVQDALHNSSELRETLEMWRTTLLPSMSESDFADNFAQTAMAGLLMAKGLTPEEQLPAFGLAVASQVLRNRGHELTAQVLSHVDAAAQTDEKLEVCLSAIVDGAAALEASKPADDDWWLVFYEAFVKEYDRTLQTDRGVFYTPREIVDYQIRCTDWVLRNLLHKPHGFASDDVVTLDPACGTGTYLTRLVEYVASDALEEQGKGAVGEAVSQATSQMHGFELMVAPHTIANMRLRAKCESYGAGSTIRPVVLLTDTLAETQRDITPQLFADKLADEQSKANSVKDPETRVTVVIGNPPYDRDQTGASSTKSSKKKRRLGGIIRYGDRNELGLLRDFKSKTPPEMRQQIHTIHEMATYFWRWAVWKVCEQEHLGYPSPGGPGIVSYITPSAYLRSDAWGGMRAHLRSRFDHIWVVDLGGNQRSARDDGKNVFPIRTPVCITVAVRTASEASLFCQVLYRKLHGSRAEKLSELNNIRLDGDCWTAAPAGDADPFVALDASDLRYTRLLPIDEVLTWQTPGVQYNRTWPIALTQDILLRRWRRLLEAPKTTQGMSTMASVQTRASLFKETDDRKVSHTYEALEGGPRARSIDTLSADESCPRVSKYSHRPFDARWTLPDNRVGDRLRPELWSAHSDKQAYLVIPSLSEAAGLGPTAVVYVHPPDKHSHHGRGGVVFPLWRDRTATDANAEKATLSNLTDQYGRGIAGEDLWHYCAGLLGTRAYTDKWWDPMEVTLKPHVPFPNSFDDFLALAALGQRLVEVARGLKLTSSGVKCTAAVDSSKLPHFTDRCYCPDNESLSFGEGKFTGVTWSLWNFQVCGYYVLRRWIKARSSKPGGQRSSELDHIRPDHWDFTSDLIHVCNQIASLIEVTEQARPIIARMGE